MRISDWSSTCALPISHAAIALVVGMVLFGMRIVGGGDAKYYAALALWFRLGEAWRLLAFVSLAGAVFFLAWFARSEEHTSELQSLMRISYAVFCLKKKT